MNEQDIIKSLIQWNISIWIVAFIADVIIVII